jgi:hypothetical protein
MQSSHASNLEHLIVPLDPIPVRHIRNADIVSRDVAGETIVVPISRGGGDLDSVYMFNPLGRELWLLLEEGRTGEELAKWVTTHYQVPPEQAMTDIHDFLAELREVGLIHST